MKCPECGHAAVLVTEGDLAEISRVDSLTHAQGSESRPGIYHLRASQDLADLELVAYRPYRERRDSPECQCREGTR
jgi:hypothetical protein